MSLDTWLVKQLSIWRSYGEIGIDEKNTEDKVITPLLNQLGWDTTNFDHVKGRITVSGKVVDYILYGKENKELVMIEVKRLSAPLAAAIRKRVIDVEKYLSQAKELGVELLILTNGLSYRFYARPEESAQFVHCSNLEINMGKEEVEPEKIKRYAAILNLLSRENMLSGDSIRFIKEQVTIENGVERIVSLIKKPSDRLVSFLSEEASLPHETTRKAFEYIEFKTARPDLKRVFQSLPSDILPPPDFKIIRRMTDRTAGAREWRRKVSKYFLIWEYLLEHKLAPKSLILEMVSSIVPSVKGRGVFFSAYVGKTAKTPFLEYIQSSTEAEEHIKVQDKFRDAFAEMVELLRKEEADK